MSEPYLIPDRRRGTYVAAAEASREPYDERVYRFAVKCDRAMAKRIEAAAQDAGVSTTTFVQNHFEAILDGPAGRPIREGEDFIAVANRLGVAPGAARLLEMMVGKADRRGFVTAFRTEMADEIGMPLNTLTKHLGALQAVGAVSIEKLGGGKWPSIWRVRS